LKTIKEEGMAKKETAIAFLKMVADRNIRDAYEKFIAADFLHHNQYFKGDRQSLMLAMEQAALKNPDKILEVKQAFEDGDTVITLSTGKMPQTREELSFIFFGFAMTRLPSFGTLDRLSSKTRRTSMARSRSPVHNPRLSLSIKNINDEHGCDLGIKLTSQSPITLSSKKRLSQHGLTLSLSETSGATFSTQAAPSQPFTATALFTTAIPVSSRPFPVTSMIPTITFPYSKTTY
jgi:hypothetical protein